MFLDLRPDTVSLNVRDRGAVAGSSNAVRGCTERRGQRGRPQRANRRYVLSTSTMITHSVQRIISGWQPATGQEYYVWVSMLLIETG
jgi:hypothetical protein